MSHAFWPDLSAQLPELTQALASLLPPDKLPSGERPSSEPVTDEAEAESAPGGPRVGAQASFVGPYELLRQIGEGGVASIWRARHLHPSFAARPTVIKLLHAGHREDPRLAGLFRREADVLSLVRHPNVVQTYDAGQHGGAMYLGMAYVAGCDLAHLLWRTEQEKMRLPAALWAYVAHEVAAGLAYAHHLRDLNDRPLHLVHRDVNPANVLLSFAGEVKLSDFGVAFIRLQKRIAVQELAGKAGYFPPEQLAGAAVDARGDVYALGATLFEMLAGRPLFAGTNLDAVMALNRAGALPADAEFLPGHEPALRAVLRRALALAPEQRFADAAAMQAALAPLCPDRAAAQLLLKSLVSQLFGGENVEGQAAAATRPSPGKTTVTPAAQTPVGVADAPALPAATTAALPATTTATFPATSPAASPATSTAASELEDRREGMSALPRAIDLIGLEPLASRALVDLFGQQKWSCATFANLEDWRQQRVGLHPPAPVAIVDVAQASIAQAAGAKQVGQVHAGDQAPPAQPPGSARPLQALVSHLQVIALATSFDVASAQAACGLGAQALWVPPFAVDWALVGVFRAYAAATRAAGGARLAARTTSATRLNVLTVGCDAELQQLCAAEAERRGDALHHAADFAQAQALSDAASYDLLLLWPTTAIDTLTAQLSAYRQSWGMGDVPCLWLHAPTRRTEEQSTDRPLSRQSSAAATTLASATTPRSAKDMPPANGSASAPVGVSALPALPPRSAWQPLSAPWQPALQQAYSNAAPGQVRAFARYPVAINAALRLDGQVHEAKTVNVSRRGLLLQTAVWPSVGTEVMLTLYLAAGLTVQVRGRALRVAMAPGSDKAMQDAGAPAHLGIALTTFVRDGEAAWLGWLKPVAAAAAAAQAKDDKRLVSRLRRWLRR